MEAALLLVERAGHDEHHRVGNGDADECAHGGCDDVVGDALEQEHFDEVPLACADGARDPEFTTTLRREHDEDQKITGSPPQSRTNQTW